jgi:hypothetical protein
VSNATFRRLPSSVSGRTSISDGQLYSCSYAQLLVLMDASAHRGFDMDGIKALPASHSIRAYLAVLFRL